MLGDDEANEIHQARLLVARLIRKLWSIIKWGFILQWSFLAVVLGVAWVVTLFQSREFDPRVKSCQYERRLAGYDRGRPIMHGWYACSNSFKGVADFDMTDASDVNELKKRYRGSPIRIELEEPIISAGHR